LHDVDLRMPKCADLFTTGISFSFHKICVSFIKLSVSSTSYSESSQLGTCIELTSVLDAVCGTEVLFCAYSLFENDELDCKKRGKAYGGAGYVQWIGVGVNRLLLFKSSTV